MRSSRVAGGLLVILVGLMLLLVNLGYMDMVVWNLLFRYWPVLLIAGGICILLPRPIPVVSWSSSWSPPSPAAPWVVRWSAGGRPAR